MAKTPTSNQNAGGLHSRKDRSQGVLRDERQGTYDPVANQKTADTSQPTPHEKAQPGGAMQGEPVPDHGAELPEGLKRDRKGPYGREHGRGKVPGHVPRGSIRGH